MKLTKEVQETVTVIADIICNKCGCSCRTNGTESSCTPQFDGLIEARVHGGYWSKIIGDGTQYNFSLCETCTIELVSTFKIKALIDDDSYYENDHPDADEN